MRLQFLENFFTMKKNIKVFKFGGASVKDAASIRNVANILKNHKNEKLVIVVSAMGKTTNALEKILKTAFEKNENLDALIEELKENHVKEATKLMGKNDELFKAINQFISGLRKIIQKRGNQSYDKIYDQVVSVGELLSTKIVHAFLNKKKLSATWVDARKIIKTDNTYREGRIDWEKTELSVQKIVRPLLRKNGYVVTQGFIGGSREKTTTTLGREGSDFSAAILSYCLDAEEMSIWKDVEGIMTGDPRLFKKVTKIDRLSYREAIEMTYYGAKVIHPKTIKPIQNKSIPLYVRSFINPKGKGTLISGEADIHYPPVVVVEKEQVLVQIATKDFSFVAEHHLSYIFKLFTDYRIKVNMMQNMAISFSVCITLKDINRLNKAIKILSENFEVRVEKNLELITIRHYHQEVIKQMKKGKIVLLEERIRQTIQLVMKDVPIMERKD